jgi:imidazolonepropionase
LANRTEKPLAVIDAENRYVLPAYCDSHTHLVFAATREEEFVDRIKGLTYEEIAQKGGGILNSAKKMATISEEKLLKESLQRLHEIALLGTGAVEIKSGYGLSVDAELKMLRIIKKLKEQSDLIIKSTFLGAHAIPQAYKNNRQKYIDLIINEMLPKVAEENLADYVDIFTETNYFNIIETEHILDAALQYGLKPKIHVNQFTSIGGVEVATLRNAVSVDHLEVMEPHDFTALENSNTIATALPSCSFFINIPYAPARKIIDRNIPLALATDYNPGSTPSGNMNFVQSLACIKMGLLPEEALNAVTINGAFAMEVDALAGSISVGKQANFIITKEMPSLYYLPYAFGSNVIDRVFLNGKEVTNAAG